MIHYIFMCIHQMLLLIKQSYSRGNCWRGYTAIVAVIGKIEWNFKKMIVGNR